jgi:WD40 repeat protein/serine/threonine protein kinase
MNNDQNLLFGILAVQLRRVTPNQLVEAAAAWATDPSKDLALRLIEGRVIDASDRDRINAYVDEAIKAHEGNPHAALDSLEAAHRVHDTIASIGRSLKSVSPRDATKQASQRWLDLGPVAAVPAVDETPGRYTQPSEYARGGIGRVLLVHDQHLGREIALKELLPVASADGTTLDPNEPTPVQASTSLIFRFLQEARITGQLEHPSIVPVYELGRRKDGTIYYTMKLVRGRTFAQAIREARTLRERLELLPHTIDLCQAIGYAHSRNVIHRDIKPNNVMIGEFGETVVLDWGLAKVRGQEDVHASQIEHTLKTLRITDKAGADATGEGQILGTPTFMPPEQAQGDLKNITERSDVYSLGAVLYNVLTGKHPYDGSNAREILNQVLHQDPAPIPSIEPGAPPELVAICQRAMERDPRKRYANGRELAEELLRFHTGALVGAYSYGFHEHLWRFVKRHKAVLSTAAAFMVVLLGILAYSYIRISQDRTAAVEARDRESEQRVIATKARDDEREQRERAEQQLYLSNVLLAQDRIDERRYDVADGVLDAAPAAFRNWEWNYLKRLCHQEEWTFAGHRKPVEDMAVSPDGAFVLSGSQDGTVRVLDSATGQELQTLDRLEGWMQHVRINADGSRALLVASNQSPRLWNLATMELAADLDGHPDTVRSARFSPDGRWIVTGSGDGTIKIWNAETGVESSSLLGEPHLLEVVFSFDGLMVAERGTSPVAVVYEPATGERIAELIVPEGFAEKVVFSPDGRWVAVTHGTKATIWQYPEFTPVLTLPEHETVIASVSFSPSGGVLATGGEDGSIRTWDATATWNLAHVTAHDSAVTDLAFLDSPLRLVSASLDHTVRVWDVASGEEIRRLDGHNAPVRRIEFAADGQSVFTCSDDHTVKRWPVSVPPGSPQLVLRGHSDANRTIQFNPDGKSLLSVSEDGTARVWNVDTGVTMLIVAPERGEVFCAAWSPDGQVIATGLNDKTARMWDAATGETGPVLEGHESAVSGVYFGPDGSRLLTVSWDESGILWDLRTGRPIHRVQLADGRRGLAAFSPDGSRAATVTADFGVTLWDTVTGITSTVLQGHTNRISAIRFARDATRVLTTSLDGTARLWDAATGESVAVLDGERESLQDGVFSPDGLFAATASSDGVIQLWDSLTGDRIGDLLGHRDAVTMVLFLGDGARIFSGSEDGTVRLWDVKTGAAVLAFSRGGLGTGGIVAAGPRQLAGTLPDGSVLLWSD